MYKLILYTGANMGRPIKDLSGQKFGKLEVISFSHKIKTNIYYNCLCSCNEFLKKDCIISSKSIKNGTISCGCECSYLKKGKNNINWKGCGELSLNFFNRYKLNAETKKLEFNITIEYAWEIFEKQDKKCSITGLPLVFNKTFKTQADRTASLDRIDSSKGYVEGNVQWVHKLINYFKRNMPNDMFIDLCNLIAAKNKNVVDYDKLKLKIETYKYLWNSKGQNQGENSNE